MKLNKTILSILSLLVLTSCSTPSSSETESTSIDDADITALSTFSSEERDTYNNQFDDDKRLPTVEFNQAADPFVLRHNGMYYLYVTTGGGQLLGWKSKDLLTWEQVRNGYNKLGYVYEGELENPWATEVRYINGKFYLITSFAGSGHYILTSDSPEGPFTFHNNKPLLRGEIDGSIFIDTNDDIYVTAANGNGVLLHKMSDDMTSYQGSSILYDNTKIGNWTEGPYIQKRFGEYYLTYTGNHYAVPSYRVHYNYLDGESLSIDNKEAFSSHGGPILLNTDYDYAGLGHSANFLGPDLDSYYMSYHDLNLSFSDKGSITRHFRSFNFSRLSFNGSKLVVDNQDKENQFVPRRPEFETYDIEGLTENNGVLLSSIESEDNFSSEYNLVGNAKMLFSYVNESNYHYLDISNNSLKIYEVKDNNASLIEEASLNNISLDVNHTLRINYGDNLLNVYFDDIEKITNLNIDLPLGKIGYKDYQDSDIGYTALSLVGHGSSDKEEYQKHQSLANQYDLEASILTRNSGLYEITTDDSIYSLKDSYAMNLKNKNDRATYKVYSDSSTKNITIQVPQEMANKKIGVRINDNERIEVHTPNSNDLNRYINVNLGNFDMNIGKNYVSIENIGDEVTFSQLSYQDIDTDIEYYSSLKEEENLVISDHGFDDYVYCPDGLRTYGENNNYFAYKDRNLTDVTVSARVAVNACTNINRWGGSDRYGAGIMIAGDNHEYSTGDAQWTPIMSNVQGLFFGFSEEKVFIRKMRYYDSVTLYEHDIDVVKSQSYKLELIQQGSQVECYFDGELIYIASIYDMNLVGEVALYSFYTDAIFKNFDLKA